MALSLFVLVTCSVHGAELPKPLTAVRPEFTLSGESAVRWFGLHIYDIALYTQGSPCTSNSTAVLSIRYSISIKGSKFQETMLEEWERMDTASVGQRKAWAQATKSLWPDIKSGERLTAYRVEGGATRFFHGDKEIGRVDDAGFGPAFFEIWLGEKCRYPKARDRLMKGLEERKKK